MKTTTEGESANGTDFIALRKLKEATDSKKYLLESDVTSGATYRLFGIPVTVTNKLPAGKAVLADMSQVAIAKSRRYRRLQARWVTEASRSIS